MFVSANGDTLSEESENSITLFQLPPEILHHILSFISYSEISKLRLVSKRLDKLCQNILNKGFQKVQRLVTKYNKDLKAMLPRRESQRQSHPLKFHSEILASLDTRISLLDMTFSKCIEMGLCCFIPGQVLDEIFRILKLVKSSETMERSHKVLKELRDISSMAMEHFEDSINPLRKHKFEHLHLMKFIPDCSHNSHLSVVSNGEGLPKSIPVSVPSSSKQINCDAGLEKVISQILKNQKLFAKRNNELEATVKNQNLRIQRLESMLSLKRMSTDEPIPLSSKPTTPSGPLPTIEEIAHTSMAHCIEEHEVPKKRKRLF